MKIDISGNVVWSTCYGGSFDDAGYDIISLPDGGGIAFGLTGSSDGQVTGNHGEDDFWAYGLIMRGHCSGQNVMVVLILTRDLKLSSRQLPAGS